MKQSKNWNIEEILDVYEDEEQATTQKQIAKAIVVNILKNTDNVNLFTKIINEVVKYENKYGYNLIIEYKTIINYVKKELKKINKEEFYEGKFEFVTTKDCNFKEFYQIKDGFSGYFIDKNGKVYTLNTTKDYKEIKEYNNLSRVKLKNYSNKTSYKIVKLISDNNETKQVLVQHLAAYAKEKQLNPTLTFEEFKNFLKNNSLVVDHIDNNKSNNHFDNLQIITQKENIKKYHNQIEKLQKEVRHLNNLLKQK